MWPPDHSKEEDPWIYYEVGEFWEGLPFIETFQSILGFGYFEPILEPGRIRLIRSDLAADVWRTWWEKRQKEDK